MVWLPLKVNPCPAEQPATTPTRLAKKVVVPAA
jgi:hypothetical protein